MTLFGLAARTVETVGLLMLSPLMIPGVREVSKPAIKAILKAGLIVCDEGRKLVDEARAELKKDGPALLKLGERVVQEVATDVAEALVEEEVEGAAGSAVTEAVEEVVLAAAESLL